MDRSLDEPAPSFDPETSGRNATPPTRPGPSWKVAHTKWSRLLHVYTSMISLLLVLFFGLTGITLNHPDWTFGSEPVTTTETGVLPADAFVDGEVEFLMVAEYLRDELGVRGQVTHFAETGSEGTISFKNPGYTADVFFDTTTGTYELTQLRQGWLTVVNELHKGRDGNSMWRWVVDIAGGLLVVISLTGLYLQFFLRKRRKSAMVVATVGTVVAVGLMWLALG